MILNSKVCQAIEHGGLLGHIPYVTGFAIIQHSDVFLETQIFASVSSILYLKLCPVVTSMLYCNQ